MLIVCTTDPIIVDAARTSESSVPWKPLYVVDGSLSQAEATIALAQTLQQLRDAEPLCLSAHGNNNEIGDADDRWGWTYADVAELLERNVPAYKGSILIHACATQIVNFASNLAVELENRKALNGTWIYGYNRALPSSAGFPPPDRLASQADLQGSQVLYRMDE